MDKPSFVYIRTMHERLWQALTIPAPESAESAEEQMSDPEPEAETEQSGVG
jgi:hypothetical protein